MAPINKWKNEYGLFKSLILAEDWLVKSQGRLIEKIHLSKDTEVFILDRYKTNAKPWVWHAFQTRVGWSLVCFTNMQVKDLISRENLEVFFTHST